MLKRGPPEKAPIPTASIATVPTEATLGSTQGADEEMERREQNGEDVLDVRNWCVVSWLWSSLDLLERASKDVTWAGPAPFAARGSGSSGSASRVGGLCWP